MPLKLLLSCLLLYISCCCHAQRIYTYDYVHLKNGQSIQGEIIKDIVGDYIILLKGNGDLLKINDYEIQLIIRQEIRKRHGRDKRRFYDLRTGKVYNDGRRPTANKTQDNVYLKSGTQITGHIIDTLAGDSLRIKTIKRDIVTLHRSNIDSITRKEWIAVQGRDRTVSYTYNKRPNIDSLDRADLLSGGKGKFKMAFIMGGQFNAGWGNNKYTKSQSLIGPGISPGITFQNVVSVSAFIGLTQMNVIEGYGPGYNNIFNTNKYDYYTAQFCLELRAFPLQNSRVSPLAIVGYGAGMGIFSRYLNSGEYFRAGVGFELKAAPYVKIDLSYIYNYQELLYSENGRSYAREDMPTLHLAYSAVNINFVILIKGTRYAKSFLPNGKH